MRLLIDTHIFLWMVQAEHRLSSVVRQAVTSPENEVFYSAVVSWEIATKRAKGKLAFTLSPQQDAVALGLTALSISAEHCEQAAALPDLHRDPFDRLLIAQAQMEGLVLVTADPLVTQYGIRVMTN